LVSQCTTSLSEQAVTESMFDGASIACSRAVTSIDGTGYVVSQLDDVNGVHGNMLARIGLEARIEPKLDPYSALQKSVIALTRRLDTA
jgi:hypothetical protein